MAKAADYSLGPVTFPRGWFIVAESKELDDGPLAVRFFGQDFALYRGESGAPVMLDALIQCISADKILGGLVGIDRLETASASTKAKVLEQVRQALRAIVATKPAYHCVECGYACLSLQWQCPGCRAWETVAVEATVRLA